MNLKNTIINIKHLLGVIAIAARGEGQPLWCSMVLLLAVAWLNTSSAATPLAGIWRISGHDEQLGAYTGLLELREWPEDNNLFDVVHLLRFEQYTYQDGRGVDWAWTGTATRRQDGRGQIQVWLTRGDFIAQVADQKRTAAEATPLQVLGDVKVQGDSLHIEYRMAESPVSAMTETAVRLQASGVKPIWQVQRFEQDTHDELLSFKLDTSLKFLLGIAAPDSLFDLDALEANPRQYLFKRFADYHQLPALQPYLSDPLFQRAVHLRILDHTDFEYYQQNPQRLVVINKIIDPISLAETAVRANALRTAPAEKASAYQDALSREFVRLDGMVVSSIDAAGHVQPDPDSALWTGVYIYTQAVRYKLTGEQQALDNIRQSLAGILIATDITGQSGTFARTLRPHETDVQLPWHAGVGVFAAYDWLEGGNNDMAKGSVLGMISAWEVLPADEPLRREISGHARRILDLDQFQPFADVGVNAAMAYLLAGITNSGFKADIHKGTGQTLLRNPLLKEYAQSGGGPFYLFGISDWSGNHLTLVTALTLQQLLKHTNSTDLQGWWSQAPAIAWSKHLQKLEQPLHAALAFASGQLYDASKRQDAIEQVKWALRSFPVSKHPYGVDHRSRSDVVMSPFPALPWKLDWLTNTGRQQSIRAYPLFEQAIDSYRWNDSPFTIDAPGLGDRRVPGVDYLFLYWLAMQSEIDCLMNWAEVNYANLFLPTGAVSNFLSPNVYRYYRDSNSYLMVSSVDQHVYYQGANGVKVDGGALSEWLDTAACRFN